MWYEKHHSIFVVFIVQWLAVCRTSTRDMDVMVGACHARDEGRAHCARHVRPRRRTADVVARMATAIVRCWCCAQKPQGVADARIAADAPTQQRRDAESHACTA